MDKPEIIARCMAIARLEYLNMPYEGQSILDLYKVGGIETKATEICHYCSIDVLKKIINNSTLRFTDIRCLDDTTEFVGIMPIIESVIQNENYDSNFKEFILSSETLQELRNYNQSYFKIIKEAHIAEERLYCAYTCSLSTNGNSIRMWDKYAKEGVNICFDFAWNLFAGADTTNVNVKQRLDNDIIMYKGLIIYRSEEKRYCVKKVFDSLEEVYLEVKDKLEQYAHYIFYAFKEAVNYMRCFFKNSNFEYEEEYRIVLKVPKDIIDSRHIGGEIKDIGIDDKANNKKQYIDYKIQKKSIKRVAISPLLSRSVANQVEYEINDFFQLNKLKNVRTACMSMFPFNKPLTARFRKNFVENLALRILKYCYENTYDEFDVYDAPDISDNTKTVGIEVTEAVAANVACMENEFVKYRLESNAEVKERKKQIIENNGGKLEDGVLSFPITDDNFEKSVIQNAIRKKMEKLAEYKDKGFKTIRLFIFFNEMPIPVRLETFKNYFDEILDEYDEKYDTIYFGYPCGLVEYDVVKNSIQTKHIDREDYDRLQYDVRLKIETNINKKALI